MLRKPLLFADRSMSALRPPVNDHAELTRLVEREGLLDKQTAYYALKIALSVALLGLGVALLVIVDSYWLLLLSAAYWAFTYVQFALMGHDAGHHQISRVARMNDAISLFYFDLMLGVSASWWKRKHNRHHSHPNHVDFDPDVDFPIVAFSEGQACSKRGFSRFMVRYQAFFYPLLVPLVPFNMRIYSIQALLSVYLVALWVLTTFGRPFEG